MSNLELDAKKTYSRVGIGTFLYFTLWSIGVYIVTFIASGMDISDQTYTNVVLIANFLCEAILGGGIFLLFTKKIEIKKIEPEKMSFNPFFAVALLFFFAISGSIIANIFNALLASNVGATSSSGLTEMFDQSFVVMAVFVVCGAPILEEFIFRKVLIDRVHQYGKKNAMFLSGLLFGLMHGNIEQFFYAFFIGYFFAYIYLHTGKLRYSIMLHMLMNSMSVVLQWAMSSVAEKMGDGSVEEIMEAAKAKPEMIMIILFIVFAEYSLAFIGCLYYLIKKPLQIDEEISDETPYTFNMDSYYGSEPVADDLAAVNESKGSSIVGRKVMLKSPGIIVVIIAMFAMMVLNFIVPLLLGAL